MAVPAFSDIAKASNDVSHPHSRCLLQLTLPKAPEQGLLPYIRRYANFCFAYALIVSNSSAAALEVKSVAPNGVSFNVKGKSSHEGSTAGNVSIDQLLSAN